MARMAILRALNSSNAHAKSQATSVAEARIYLSAAQILLRNIVKNVFEFLTQRHEAF